RSASTAAPLLVLVGVVLGLSGALSTMSAAGRAEQVRDLAGDLVVSSSSPLTSPVPGVAAASAETTVPVTVTFDKHDKSKTKDVEALAVDADAYRQLHRLAPPLLAELHGMTIAAGSDDDTALGETVSAQIG